MHSTSYPRKVPDKDLNLHPRQSTKAARPPSFHRARTASFPPRQHSAKELLLLKRLNSSQQNTCNSIKECKTIYSTITHPLWRSCAVKPCLASALIHESCICSPLVPPLQLGLHSFEKEEENQQPWGEINQFLVFFLNDTFSPGLLANESATGNSVSAKNNASNNARRAQSLSEAHK